jgi:hypothetical protein
MINDFIEQISNTELEITKNIILYVKDKNKYEYIKDNLVLLGFNNKLGKNSLNILLEHKEYDVIKDLININYKILNFKNLSEKNLLQSLLLIDNLNTYILGILEFLYKENKYFLNKILLNNDSSTNNFIDILILLLSKNEKITLLNIIDPLLSILNFLFKINDYTKIIINKLCFIIDNDDYLLYILKKININNIEITQTFNNHLCIDYLYFKNNIKSFKYIITNSSIINFTNIDENIIFNLINKIDKDMPQLIIELINKSNILEIRDLHNNNIILLFIKRFNIDDNIINNLIKSLKQTNIIFEKNNENISIYDLIKNKKIINIKIHKKFNYKKIKKILCCDTNIGIFNSDTLHNVIYTNMILEKYHKKISICAVKYDKTQQINDIFKLEICDNDSNIYDLINLYINNFYNFHCHLIIWKDNSRYYINDVLINYLKENCNNNYKKRFIYIKLSIIINEKNIRHANLILIDNKYKLIERFEPYGDIHNEAINGLDELLKIKIADVINYKYDIIQSFPGYQTKTNEYNLNYKSFGDPGGYCLAWCFLFLEVRLIYDNLTSKEVISLINNYILNIFEKDFKDILKDEQLNKFLVYIRHYGKSLDQYKNKLLLKLNISLKTIYHLNLNDKIYNQICSELNKNIEKLLYSN